MRVLLVWASLTVIFMESYSFVVSQNDTVEPNSDTDENKTEHEIQQLHDKTITTSCPKQMFLAPDTLACMPIINTSDLTVEITPRSKLCVDEQGNEIYGTIRYKTDCRKFVQCGPSIEFVVECQSGLLFNDFTKACDWPREANCIDFKAKDETKLVIPASDIVW